MSIGLLWNLLVLQNCLLEMQCGKVKAAKTLRLRLGKVDGFGRVLKNVNTLSFTFIPIMSSYNCGQLLVTLNV